MTLARRLTACVLVAALAALALLIIADGRVNWALETAPGTALRFAPRDSRALAASADNALASAKTPEQVQGATVKARAALAHGPTQMDALRDLGLARAVGGDIPGAYRILSLAGAMTPLDEPTHLWLMDARLLAGNYAGAFKDADDLLRHQPDSLDRLAPILIAYAVPGASALAARLATSPPWRGAFVEDLARGARDPATPFVILADLKARGAPPTDPELAVYLDRRLADHAYDAAYVDWLQLLPRAALARAGAIYDGGFRGPAGAGPFVWTLESGVGGEAEISPSAGDRGNGALHVQYDGYSTPGLASQLLVLAPGSWRLTGRVRSRGDADGALAWTVACADAPQTLLARGVAPGAPDGWRDFALAFQTPARGCPAQWLRLVPIPADHQRPMEAWFTDLVLARG